MPVVSSFHNDPSLASLDLASFIREVPNFPKEGILFFDISPLLKNAEAWQVATAQIIKQIAPLSPDFLVAIESRGFLMASAVAVRLGCGVILLRKAGKLPGDVIAQSYGLEYGHDTLEIQKDALKEGQKVVIMDDLLATGGTLNAAEQLINKTGAETVGISVMLEIPALKGRQNLKAPVFTLMDCQE